MGNANTKTKKDFALAIASELGMQQGQVAAVIDAFLDKKIAALAAGERIEFRTFGTFTVVERKAKVGRNPKKPSESIAIPARFAVKFEAGKQMKDEVSKAPSKKEEQVVATV